MHLSGANGNVLFYRPLKILLNSFECGVVLGGFFALAIQGLVFATKSGRSFLLFDTIIPLGHVVDWLPTGAGRWGLLQLIHQ